MKKTTFKEIELSADINYHRTYMEYLDANNIKYTTRTLPIFQTLLPLDTLSYGGYEVSYKDENGHTVYVYPFITEKRDYTKCVTFFAEGKLDNLYLLDLEQALRTGKLAFAESGELGNVFAGFDFSKEWKVEELLDKAVLLDDGSVLEFIAINEFPKGITGKKIQKNGEAVNILLAKADSAEPCCIYYEAASGWEVWDKQTMAAILGRKNQS